MTACLELAKEFLPHLIDVKSDASTAYLAVLSDVHQGLNNRPLFQRAVTFLQTIPNMYVLLGGDATNSNTRHSKGIPCEEWTSGTGQILTLVEDLKPLVDSGQLIGITTGNHPQRVADETFITPEVVLASMLGRPDLYKGPLAIVYFNVLGNMYVHTVMHKGYRRMGYYDYMNTDVLWLEHYHKPQVIEKVMVDHNRFTKKPIVKKCFEVHNGTFQTMPEYAKRTGYRPSIPGFYIAEMDGPKNGYDRGAQSRDVRIWRDFDLKNAIERGYA